MFYRVNKDDAERLRTIAREIGVTPGYLIRESIRACIAELGERQRAERAAPASRAGRASEPELEVVWNGAMK